MRAAAAMILLMLALTSAACDEDDTGAQPPQATSTPSVEPATPIAYYISPTPLPSTRVISFDNAPQADPAATPADLYGKPFEFGPWDETSTVIYDFETGDTINLGSTEIFGEDNGGRFGERVDFDPNGSSVAWIEHHSGEPSYVWVMDLESRVRTRIGETGARDFATFNKDGSVYVSSGVIYNRLGTVLPVTRTPPAGVTPSPPSDEIFYGVPSGYRLFMNYTGNMYTTTTKRFVVTELSGTPILEFEAFEAQGIEGGLLVRSPAVDPSTDAFRSSTTNMYFVDLPSGDAQFVATVPGDSIWSANDDFFVWSTYGCSEPERGETYIMDRHTHEIRRLPLATRGGALEDGSFLGAVIPDSTFSTVYLLRFDLRSLRRTVVVHGVYPFHYSDNRRYFSPYLRIQGAGICPI